MTHYVCVTCGVQFAASAQPPAHCPICEDERQYVGWAGQQWATLDALRRDHKTVIRPEGPGLVGIGTEPGFAIGQRALLVQAEGGNVLWDCITLIDDAAIAEVKNLGGLRAIAISHPHYFSSIVEWSRAFGDAPIYLHAALKPWVMRPDPAIEYWEGERLELGQGLTLINAGIHFEGGTLLHWAAGAEGQGALLAGDIFQVVQDRRWVSFMYSYPNLIPERPATIREALRRVEPYAFDHLYGAWWERKVIGDAKGAVWRSAERYLARIES
ncbi:MAG: MBL fold metallo-hydrolase [Anaerolineae bacterium]|nr:MBL fold metallo-hydrolase [Anaerolineae bacterium]